MAGHQFGGKWTQEKLEKVKHYLQTYVTALKNQRFQLIYIDAFAGTGYINKKDSEKDKQIFFDFEEDEVKDFIVGSARNALEVAPPFDEYIFIEKNERRLAELEILKTNYPHLAKKIVLQKGDCNEYLQQFCRGDWRFKRAVIFLDPYGMEVKWRTIEAIASTQAIDLWILFPLGVAVNRFLRKDGIIPETEKYLLDEMFGTSDWFQEFFKEKKVVGLFDTETGYEKTANLDSIASYFNMRLASVFAGVSKTPLKLYNMKNNPLYLLCFAVGNPNPKAKELALKFANYILRMR